MSVQRDAEAWRSRFSASNPQVHFGRPSEAPDDRWTASWTSGNLIWNVGCGRLDGLLAGLEDLPDFRQAGR